MIGRFTGAILGLLAFSVSIVAGLVVQNSFPVILSRAIGALCIFFVIGLVTGTAAQFVINDYARRRLKESLTPAAGVTARRQQPQTDEESEEVETSTQTPAGAETLDVTRS